MRRDLKTLLLWLLVAVLPLQGVAAAAMTSCHARLYPGQAAMETAKHHHAGKMMHLHASGSAVDVDVHAMHHAHHQGDHQGDHQLQDKHDASTSCSACAACCIGAAALPAGLDWTFVRNGSEPVQTFPSPFMTGFIPAGLERPPRPLHV
jgi:hypothetical protein